MATFFFFFFFFFKPGVKLDEKSIENGLEGQKFLVACLFWGGCHHPNLSRFHDLSVRLKRSCSEEHETRCLED